MAASLEPSLDDALRRARAAWPNVHVDAVAFERYVLERIPTDKRIPTEAHASETFADLYLAFACLHADPAALAVFDKTYLAQVGAFIAHVDRDPSFVDEVRQLLREKLLVGGSPGIAAYRGSGSLGGFVRVAALRIALNLRRGERRAMTREYALSELGASLPPELSYLRERYRDVFAEVLREAVEALSERDRALLRLYHAEGLALEALAALYRVHVSTVSRWLTCAREQLAETALRRLRERLGIGAQEADSIAALVMSQVEISLAGLFRS